MADVNTSIVLIITEDKLKTFITIRDETMLNQKVLADLIQEREIKFGIDRETLDDLLKNPRTGTFIIAQGRSPKEGKDGYMQYLFTSKAVKQDNADQSVDFREVFNIPSVNANTVLAVYHPAVPGEDGITVTGQPIPARPVVELTLRTGKGTALSADGLSVTSTTNGRPWVRKQGRNVTMGVDSVYNHEGDVDIKSGNLRFSGDVIIGGNITESMVVEISGNLRVMGFVSRATVKVTGNLEVMKVVTASKINAGGSTVSYSKIENKLREIQETISSLDAKAQVLMKNLAERQQNIQFGQIVMALLDKQYKNFDKQIPEFKKLVKAQGTKPPKEIEEVMTALSAMSGIKILSLPNLVTVKNSIAAALSFLDSMSKEPSNIAANSVWNSEIEATGDIKITGQGAFNSQVTALGSVEARGMFRGGEIFAAAGIRVGEIGGPMGVKTVAKTKQGSMIKANRVFNGSLMQIGSRIHTVQHDQNMVLARLNENGDIVMH